MAENGVRVEGLDKLLKKLERMGPPIYKPAIAEGAAHVKSKLAEYPPRRYGPQPPWTMKQRIFLITSIREGTLQVPYKRTGNLGKRWTVAFRDGGLTAAVGNNAPGAKWVQSAEDQSLYHKETGWKTDKQVAEEEAQAVKEILQRHIRGEINR